MLDVNRGAWKTLVEISRKNKLKFDPLCGVKKGGISLIETIGAISDRAWMSGRGMIGFSTGCLHYSGMPLLKRLKIYLRTGATSLELSFATPNELMSFVIDDAVMSKLRKFASISLHAPWKNINYFDGSSRTDPVISKILELHTILHFSGVVFHPDIISSIGCLEVVNLPVLIENMDKRKTSGITAEEMARIKRDYDVGFVLDLQHAFEHDSSMGLAREMIEVMGDKLHHFHVSGCTPELSHAPVHLADNRQKICQTLRILPSTSVILEGVLIGNSLNVMAAKEYLFVRENGNPIK